MNFTGNRLGNAAGCLLTLAFIACVVLAIISWAASGLFGLPSSFSLVYLGLAILFLIITVTLGKKE